MAFINFDAFGAKKTVKMNGLRVYFYTVGADMRKGQTVFYSRRADGPYYHWRYEEKLGQWCCARVRLPDPTLKALCIANWKTVPTALQARLSEHYLE